MGRSNKKVPNKAHHDYINYFNQAAELYQQGRLTQAEAAYRKSIAANPGFPGSHNDLGNVLKDRGLWPEAEQCYRKALSLVPDNSMVLSNLGNALFQQGKLEEAERLLQQAVNADESNPLAANNLGNVYVALERYEDAVRSFQRALELAPGVAEIHSNLARALIEVAHYEQARNHLDEAIRIEPSSETAWLSLAELAHRLDHSKEEIEAYQRVLDINENSDIALSGLADLFGKGDPFGAKPLIEKAVSLVPDNARYYVILGSILDRLQQWDEAERAFSKAVELTPEDSEILADYGYTQGRNGKAEAAIDTLRKAISLKPTSGVPYLQLAELKTFSSQDEDAEAMKKALRSSAVPEEELAAIYFALGKVCEDLNDYDQAFSFFDQANKVPRSKADTSEISEQELFSGFISAFSGEGEFFNEAGGSPENLPIIISGLSRSGKSLLEKMIAGHSSAVAAGEVDQFAWIAEQVILEHGGQTYPYPKGICDLDSAAIKRIGDEYIARLRSDWPQAGRVIVTTPGNIRHLGLIHRCLPNASIILCMREPRDVCVANFKKFFDRGNYYSNDLKDLGEFYLTHEKLCDLWIDLLGDSIQVVRFEELVCSPREQLQSVLEFCGLPWEESCVDVFSETSISQGAWPKPENVIGIWKHYEKHLSPLLEIIQQSPRFNASLGQFTF